MSAETVADAAPVSTVDASSSPAPTRRPGIVARVLLGGISLYQGARAGRPSPCRFVPTCSHYGREAIEVHGAARGTWLTVRRLLRCRPGGPSGVDLVPAPPTAKG